ncbi:hypothetical protein [Novosphingobium sp. B-7]|uniref:hypothetical protein n=1 Tax=Novosphingobium sp. B-7 TaxID=1298855 RepID=UPI000401AE41|nr:hypothetical protein [Novosphingobium sp. B-7]
MAGITGDWHYALCRQFTEPGRPWSDRAAWLRYATLADPEYALARQLGITFFPEDQPSVAPGTPWIGATLGIQSYEMTQPAIVIIDPDHTLRHLAVSPDWLDRPEFDAILAHLPEVNVAGALVPG